MLSQPRIVSAEGRWRRVEAASATEGTKEHHTTHMRLAYIPELQDTTRFQLAVDATLPPKHGTRALKRYGNKKPRHTRTTVAKKTSGNRGRCCDASGRPPPFVTEVLHQRTSTATVCVCRCRVRSGCVVQRGWCSCVPVVFSRNSLRKKRKETGRTVHSIMVCVRRFFKIFQPPRFQTCLFSDGVQWVLKGGGIRHGTPRHATTPFWTHCFPF